MERWLPLLSTPLTLVPVRFLLSGGTATGLHWMVMVACIAAGMPATPATIVGATAGAILNYCLQYRFTFRVRVQHRRSIPTYLMVSAFAWIANAGGFALFHLLLHWQAAVAQGITSALVALLNFFLYKRVVFDECSRPRLAT